MITQLQVRCSIKQFLPWRNNRRIARYNLGNAIWLKLEKLESFGAIDFDVGVRYLDQTGHYRSLWVAEPEPYPRQDLERYSGLLAAEIIDLFGKYEFTGLEINCLVGRDLVESIVETLNLRDYRVIQ